MNAQVVINEKKEQIKSEKTSLSKVRYLTVTGIMAALIMIMTAYICHIPVGVNGGYVHFGDSLIYLAAAILPKPYAIAAAAIGGGMADLLTAPMWTIATIIIKMLIAIPFTYKEPKIITPRNVLAAVLAYFISGLSYFVAEYILFGSWSVLLVSMSQSLVQSGGSAIFFIILGLALDKAHMKRRLFD